MVHTYSLKIIKKKSKLKDWLNRATKRDLYTSAFPFGVTSASNAQLNRSANCASAGFLELLTARVIPFEFRH